MKALQDTLQEIIKFCQMILAVLWIYQGLIPKVIFQVADEQYLWQQLHLPNIYIPSMIVLSGIMEMIFGSLFLWISHKYLHWLNIIALIGLFFCILVIYPHKIYQAFNPVVMNLAMISLSLIALRCMVTLSQYKSR